ncbi:MAG TPA: alpha/beta hydrolase [Propionibacteriaceae bacterium]|nr:alpha/beta hydrolase [Propionibacteriaceae bacterium]
MRRTPALVLIPGLHDQPAFWEPLRTLLRGRCSVSIASLLGSAAGGDEPFTLAGAAAEVARVSREPASVCGVGLGALVAMELAANHPEQVSRLVLLTRQVALSPVLLSLPAAVLRLLPASTVQRFARQDQVLALLDQVRPIDATSVAARADVRAVVLCGARDRINRRASAALAAALPQGELRLVGKAGPGWLTPEALAAELLR